jgi:hypothetical protein
MNDNTFGAPQSGAPVNYPPPNYPPPNYPPPGPAFQQNGGHGYYVAPSPQQGFSGPANGSRGGTMSQPPTHWPLAIVALLMSGLLGGAVAVYFAYQVGQRWQAGNPAGAADASRLAKIWGIVGIAVGAFFFLLVLIGSAGGGSSY